MCDKVNELCIVKWLVDVNEYQWYIGYIMREVENGFVIDHLHRVSEKNKHAVGLSLL